MQKKQAADGMYLTRCLCLLNAVCTISFGQGIHSCNAYWQWLCVGRLWLCVDKWLITTQLLNMFIVKSLTRSFFFPSRLPAAALPQTQASQDSLLSISVAEVGARLREQSLCGGSGAQDIGPDPQPDRNSGNYHFIYSVSNFPVVFFDSEHTRVIHSNLLITGSIAHGL